MSKKEQKIEETEKKNIKQDTEQLAEQQPEATAELTDADRVQELGEKLAALNDKYLRLAAEER